MTTYTVTEEWMRELAENLDKVSLEIIIAALSDDHEVDPMKILENAHAMLRRSRVAVAQARGLPVPQPEQKSSFHRIEL